MSFQITFRDQTGKQRVLSTTKYPHKSVTDFAAGFWVNKDWRLSFRGPFIYVMPHHIDEIRKERKVRETGATG